MRLSRRRFLRLLGAATTGVLTACTGQGDSGEDSEPPAGSGESTDAERSALPAQSPSPQRHKEAPELAQRVLAGQLPPVEERLPIQPLVLEPNGGRSGAYGGALRSAYRRQWPNDTMEMALGVGKELERLCAEHFLSFNRDFSLRPNLCEWWELNDDSSELTLRLRQGLRWSDGTPFTTQDVRFYLDHRPGAAAAGDRVLTPDDHTIVFRWGGPAPDAVVDMALRDYHYPSTYLKQFHADFADPDTLKGLLQQDGSPITWENLFAMQTTWQRNPECPVLGAWRRDAAGAAGDVVLARNPYFWQTDPDGQQLPYVDRVQYREYTEGDTFRMWLANGELDYQAEGLQVSDCAWLQEHAQDGNYRVALSPSTWHITLQLNLAVTDEPLHTFFDNLGVRRAIMVAIDREEINTLYYAGLCSPRQYSPIEASAYYHERLATGYTEYDTDQAEALLDEAGYSGRDVEGYRLHPDGTRVSFEVVGVTQANTADDDAIVQVCRYLGDVGIECTYRRVAMEELSQLTRDNLVQAAWVPYYFPLLLWEAWYMLVGYGKVLQPWASGYGYYWYPGTEGVEPPEGHWIYGLWEAIDAMRSEPDERRKGERMRHVLDIWADQVPLIGVLGQAPQPQVVAAGLQSFMNGLPYDLQVRGMHLQYPQQLYWDKPEAHT